jgi:hypothetical protein
MNQTAQTTDDTLRYDATPWVAGEYLGSGLGVWQQGDDETPICRIPDRPDAKEIRSRISATMDLLDACRAVKLAMEIANDQMRDEALDVAGLLVGLAIEKAEGCSAG